MNSFIMQSYNYYFSGTLPIDGYLGNLLRGEWFVNIMYVFRSTPLQWSEVLKYKTNFIIYNFIIYKYNFSVFLRLS